MILNTTQAQDASDGDADDEKLAATGANLAATFGHPGEFSDWERPGAPTEPR